MCTATVHVINICVHSMDLTDPVIFPGSLLLLIHCVSYWTRLSKAYLWSPTIDKLSAVADEPYNGPSHVQRVVNKGSR